MKKQLTIKQQAFVDAYLGEARGNATEAARLAGYEGNDKTLQVVGAENLSKPMIAEIIDKTRAETAEKAGISRETILKNIVENAQEAREAKQFSSAIKGWELAGKDQGMFSDKHVHEHKGTVNFIVEK